MIYHYMSQWKFSWLQSILWIFLKDWTACHSVDMKSFKYSPVLAKVKHKTMNWQHRHFSIHFLLIIIHQLHIFLKLTSLPHPAKKKKKRCKHTHRHWWLMTSSGMCKAREQMINHFIIAPLISRTMSVCRILWKQIDLHIINWFQTSCGPNYWFFKRY